MILPLLIPSGRAFRRALSTQQLSMKAFSKILLVLCAGAFAWTATANVGSATMINNNDKIWDALSTQGNMTLKGKYKESPQNGLVEQELEVEFQHLNPGSSVDVSIDGVMVGSATAGADRVARFNVRLLVTPGPDGRPTGPRVNDGSILSVSKGGRSMSATFQPRP